jgi:hypothetical protein
MQWWSSLLCWDSVFFRSISWCSQSGDNPQECLARTGYKFNVKVKCLKILLYFWLAALSCLKFWSTYDYWKSVKALYSSSFNFFIYILAIYSEPEKRQAGAWEGILSWEGARSLRRDMHQRWSVTERHNAHGRRGRRSDVLTTVGRLLKKDPGIIHGLGPGII